ncbi:hypothetical protein ACLOJK_014545 [Asimina triloba]
MKKNDDDLKGKKLVGLEASSDNSDDVSDHDNDFDCYEVNYTADKMKDEYVELVGEGSIEKKLTYDEKGKWKLEDAPQLAPLPTRPHRTTEIWINEDGQQASPPATPPDRMHIAPQSYYARRRAQ